MKKITTRAIAVLLLAILVIVGLNVYVLKYISDGRKWALTFARLNSDSTGLIEDRNGVKLAYFDAEHAMYCADEALRVANYHVTGDYWGRTGTGLLSAYWANAQAYSVLTGTTHATDSVLTLSIDAELNRTAYRALGEQVGAAMVMNYKTGEVLVMVSTPSIDPAAPNAIPAEGAFINRCLSAAFTPGSVFKLVTAAAALETLSGVLVDSYLCEGETEVAGVTISCTRPHGQQSFEQALSNSCNVVFSRFAIRVGQERLLQYVRNFGFLDRQKLDVLNCAAGSFPTEFVGDPELGWAGIGQSTDTVCPYTMLRYVAAIANGGVLCEPTLLKHTDAPAQTQLLQPYTASTLKWMMNYTVVDHYGAENFPGLNLCAKTGTAELGDGDSNGWFAGFLDDEAHPYAFVVLVERGGYGILSAAPVANTILQAAVFKDMTGQNGTVSTTVPDTPGT